MVARTSFFAASAPSRPSSSATSSKVAPYYPKRRGLALIGEEVPLGVLAEPARHLGVGEGLDWIEAPLRLAQSYFH
jgi:hypothetical protein